MTEQERQLFIDSKWMKICDLGVKYFDIKEEYEINTLTKQVRNTKTNQTLVWRDYCTASNLDKRVGVQKKSNNKNSSLTYNQLCKAIRLVEV